ncbi:MAG: twin-arginine translocase subunit TatC [Bacteroidales bacterium]|nr:twin-arginine translocase subunit TatC [Bacteroidales bacterium]
MAQTGEMTFWDHLEELRSSLLRMIAVYGIAVVTLFFFKGFLFDSVILAPSKPDFFLYRLFGADFSLTLVNIEVAAQFMIHMKITFICALIVTFPYLVFEIWRFIAPALYEREKKTIRGAFLFASVLFYIGVVVGYTIVFPLMLNFFSGYQVSPDIPNTFSLTSYISMFTSIVLMFGIVFEFPTVAVVLSSLGILSKGTLKSFRRHAICAVLILAAVITPSGDPFSLMVVSIPLYMLYEFSILICRDKGIEIE